MKLSFFILSLLFLFSCSNTDLDIQEPTCEDNIKCQYEGDYNGEYYYYKDVRDVDGNIISTHDTSFFGNLNILIARYYRKDSVQTPDTIIRYEVKYISVNPDTLFQIGLLDTTNFSFAFPMQEYIYHSGQFRNDSIYEYNCYCPSIMFNQQDCTVIRFRGKKI